MAFQHPPASRTYSPQHSCHACEYSSRSSPGHEQRRAAELLRLLCRWGTSTQSFITGQGMGGLFPARMQLSLLSLSLLGTGSPDAGPVIQEHHTLWALKLHTQLPPSKCARRGELQLCSSATSCALSCLMPVCPGVWVGCKAGFAKGILQRGYRGLWVCQIPQTHSVAGVVAAQTPVEV